MIRKSLLALTLLASASVAQAVPLLEQNFDNIGTMAGWLTTNNSAPAGGTSWFQGNAGVFDAQAGATNSYIAANFLNADFGGTISNWLISPELSLADAGLVSFYTRSAGTVPDRLEVRASGSGASANVGATDSSVGDFTTLLLTINPALAFDGYPTDWTAYTIDLTSLFAAGATGRLAFRYYVTDTNANADYIGIDSFVVNRVVPEPGTLALLMTGLLGLAFARRPRSS